MRFGETGSCCVFAAVILAVSAGCEKRDEVRRGEYRDPVQVGRTRRPADGRVVRHHHHYYGDSKPSHRDGVRHYEHHHYGDGVDRRDRRGYREPEQRSSRGGGQRVERDVVTYRDRKGREHRHTHDHHLDSSRVAVRKGDNDVIEHVHHHYYGRKRPDRRLEEQAETRQRKPVQSSRYYRRDKDGRVHRHTHNYYEP